MAQAATDAARATERCATALERIAERFDELVTLLGEVLAYGTPPDSDRLQAAIRVTPSQRRSGEWTP